MTDEITREIKDILDQGQARQDDRGGSINITVGDITGDNNTVIIGDHPRRRKEDREGGDGSHGRRASDHVLHKELRSLRRQVRTLKQLVTHLYARCAVNTVKRPTCASAACLTSNGSNVNDGPDVSNCHPPVFADRQAAEAHERRGLRSHQPTPTHINPGISFLLAPNTERPAGYRL